MMQQTQQSVEQFTGVTAAIAASLATLLAGADAIGLVLGLFAATCATFMVGAIDSRVKAFAGVLLAALLAGYGAPQVGAILATEYPRHAATIETALPLISLLIGGLAPTVIPVLLSRARGWAGKVNLP